MPEQVNIVVWREGESWAWSVGNGVARVEGGLEPTRKKAWHHAFRAAHEDFEGVER